MNIVVRIEAAAGKMLKKNLEAKILFLIEKDYQELLDYIKSCLSKDDKLSPICKIDHYFSNLGGKLEIRESEGYKGKSIISVDIKKEYNEHKAKAKELELSSLAIRNLNKLFFNMLRENPEYFIEFI